MAKKGQRSHWPNRKRYNCHFWNAKGENVPIIMKVTQWPEKWEGIQNEGSPLSKGTKLFIKGGGTGQGGQIWICAEDLCAKDATICTAADHGQSPPLWTSFLAFYHFFCFVWRLPGNNLRPNRELSGIALSEK